MNLSECKKYVKDFLNDNCDKCNLNEQIEWLKTYNFAQLGIKERVHEDSTTLAKAIHFIIWNNKLPFLTSWEEMQANYGGETINTFNSLFQEALEGAKLYISEDDIEFYSKVKNFHNNYLTIGNFMLLPLGKANGSTLNTRKGSYNYKYKDYIDLFLFDLFETSNLNDLKEANADYFKILTKECFFNINYLNDFYENGRAKIVFLHYKEEKGNEYIPYYWWQFRNHKAHSDEYRKFALDYVEQANKIIKNRADIMMDILYSNLIDQ